MTIFLSIKSIFIIRSVCKSFNQWLSYPLNFAWKRKIELTFPNSYESILAEKYDEQLRRLAVFDSLVESGHSVSYFQHDLATKTPISCYNQIPWRKHLVLIYDDDTVLLYNSNAASVLQKLNFPVLSEPLFNIAGDKSLFSNMVYNTSLIFLFLLV